MANSGACWEPPLTWKRRTKAMGEFTLSSEATAEPMEWEVLSRDDRACYWLAWGKHEAGAFLEDLEAWHPEYADEYAAPEHVKHGWWCVAGEDAEGEPAYMECDEGDPDARAATWVFIDE